MPDGDYNLERFVNAQEPVIGAALEELKAGRKRTHWMWFVFPQLRGLGSSTAAKFFGIGSMEEARAYLAHPLLGPRLVRCTEIVHGAQLLFQNRVPGTLRILGSDQYRKPANGSNPWFVERKCRRATAEWAARLLIQA